MARQRLMVPPLRSYRRYRICSALMGSLVAASLLVGCAANGPATFGQGSVATAGLSQNNFRIVKSNVRGDSYGFRLLGFIPIVPARVADAKQDLYEKLERSGVQMEGRSIALANATEDENHYYFLIGSVPRITLTADIIEFLVDRPENEKSAARTTEPVTRTLVPSTILKPSALNSSSPPNPTAAASSPSAPSVIPAQPVMPAQPVIKEQPIRPPTAASGGAAIQPIQLDAPIAEFDIPAFSPAPTTGAADKNP